MTYSAFQQPAVATSARNPFVPISQAGRALIVVYFFFWRILPSVAGLDAQSAMHAGFTSAIALLNICTELLILLPFMMKRFAGTPIGWLHPLILPTMVRLAFGLIGNTSGLLAPISVWSQASPITDHVLLVGWNDSSVLAAQLRANFINLLALVGTYFGFSLVRFRGNAQRRRPIRVNGFKLAIFFLLSLLVVLFFLQLQGGILAHMSTLAGGRYRMRELVGHFLVINNFLPYVMLVWYAYQPKAIRSPIFLAGFAVAIVLQFVVTGSRSGLFSPAALLLAVWMFHNRRVPAARTLLLGLGAVLLLGTLGAVRNSGLDGPVDFSALTEFSVNAAWEMTEEDQAGRRIGTDLAVAAMVPERQGYLYGTTYVAALAFWIPRSIWRDKPRGAGAHAAALLYGGLKSMNGYSGGGYPVSGAAEAYWNFGYPGVLFVFGLFGVVLSAVSRWVCRDSENPFALVALLIVSFGLTTPSTTAIVPALQTMVLLYLLYLFVSRLRLAR